jgi:hypothetical protein
MSGNPTYRDLRIISCIFRYRIALSLADDRRVGTHALKRCTIQKFIQGFSRNDG